MNRRAIPTFIVLLVLVPPILCDWLEVKHFDYLIILCLTHDYKEVKLVKYNLLRIECKLFNPKMLVNASCSTKSIDRFTKAHSMDFTIQPELELNDLLVIHIEIAGIVEQFDTQLS